MARLNNFRIVWKVAIIVAILGMASFLSIGFAAVRMNQADDAYSNLVNRVDAATVAVARGSRDVESFVSLIYQLVTETSAEGSSRLLSRNAEEKKMYEERYVEALRLIPEKADELAGLHLKAQAMFGGCAQVVQAVASADTCACRKLNPGISVMESAQDWATKNVPGAIDGARDRCILFQG